ncbi:gas vesicle protein GvpL [Halococcus saccharolyticus]|uniref:Gas vesicle synthesis GvpLGvpF n=1 Tax=Halococcus saccharolyticus DSM 5350 TaxID=1227455 RepID=M0MLM2_9EURY|nr:GvpL/GvpF family gas vesicle protein [Halococcus saccharolyticus]EMA46541.1 Gas vesicle synthesis GvpLGvpF [Halococcus saccharolyticus DSM 5350]
MSESANEFETGRYLYCVVTVDDETTTGEELARTGVDDEPVYLVVEDDLGAVVHACDALYDAADPDVVRKWLLDHQATIDAAGERFGTPLPFQFDTILTGDDDRVREWLTEESATLTPHLDALADHWEYRVEVSRDDAVLDEDLTADDDRLAELADRIESAGEGTAHLLETQYEQRLDELRHERQAERTRELAERLEPHASEVRELSPERSTTLDDDTNDDDAGGATTQARASVLAHESDEEVIGDVLDEVAAESGVEVRFTGPWPPYTFAPTFDE